MGSVWPIRRRLPEGTRPWAFALPRKGDLHAQRGVRTGGIGE